MEKVLFTEEQRRNQWWLWLIMLLALFASTVPSIYGIYSQEVLNEPFGRNPTSTVGLIITACVSLVVMAFVMFLVFGSKLKTKITNDAIWVAYPPIIRKWKKISPEEIDRYEIRTYRAKREYGGHGMKRRPKYGRAYTMYGNIGLQLYFKDGKKFLIGTQRKQALEYAMEKLIGKEKTGWQDNINMENRVSPLGRFRKYMSLIMVAVELGVVIIIFILWQLFK